MRKALGGLAAAALLATGCGAGQTADRPQPEQARLAATPTVTVVAAGDIACPPGARVTRRTCRQAATARAAQALSPDRVLVLGDLQYPSGRYRAFRRSYAKSWGKLRSITWPVPGNHEYETRGARGYYRYFANRQPGSPGWYRRALNGWQMYFLNSNCGKVDCAAQRAWLESEMAANPSTCSLVVTHHPRFSSGDHGNTARMRKFWQIAYRHHADVVLSGHDHDYERFAPMSPTGAVEATRGIQQFVSGGGGKNLYPRETTVPGSERFVKAFGVLELTLTPTAYSWSYRGIRLGVRDSGSAACR